ncbi:Arabinan endo-1,5-alpha-L-arabinosidase [Bacillus siamensis]|nr:glycoside hydrolase family 43 C-terminal domain-containing protein [Bacillus siamensis]OAZ58780.1 Arabinan endo-1,5-alpha-L-arabinosidase [Bacillus siamensis]
MLIHTTTPANPAATPYRCAGEPDTHIGSRRGRNLQTHPARKNITAAIKTPKTIRLNSNGTISGEMNGTWIITGSSKARINLNGTNYDGVFLHEWDSGK